MAKEEERNKNKPDMTGIKTIMQEKQCTYKEAKQIYTLLIDQAKNDQLIAANRGNKKIEELRKQTFSKVNPADFAKKSEVAMST